MRKKRKKDKGRRKNEKGNRKKRKTTTKKYDERKINIKLQTKDVLQLTIK